MKTKKQKPAVVRKQISDSLGNVVTTLIYQPSSSKKAPQRIVTVYMDEQIKAELQKRADANFRSLTAEAALILKTAMEEP